MIKHKKMIAAFVVCAFLSLLQISAMPLPDEQTPGQAGTSMSSPEKAPNFIEEEGNTGYQPKKKSMLPIILGVVAVGAIVAVLVLVVFKTKYDIVGAWDLDYVSTSPAYTWTWTLIFSGDKKSGVFDDNGDKGTYAVDGKNVTIKYDAPWDDSIAISGAKFDGKDTMSGTATFTGILIGGVTVTSASWTATRAGTGAAVSRPLARVEKKAKK